MKKLSTLLNRREALLQQLRLANLAFAYQTLNDFAERIARGGLTGRVNLQHASTDAERYWASLTAVDGNQSVIEEHFSDADIMDLADVIAFTTRSDDLDVTFPMEDVAEIFLVPLRGELGRAGITIDSTSETSNVLK